MACEDLHCLVDDCLMANFGHVPASGQSGFLVTFWSLFCKICRKCVLQRAVYNMIGDASCTNTAWC